MQRLVVVLLLCVSGFAWAHASEREPAAAPDVLTRLLALAGLSRSDVAPDPQRLAASPTRSSQFPFHHDLMAKPLDSPYRVGMLDATLRRHQHSPHALFGIISALMGQEVFLPASLPTASITTHDVPDPPSSPPDWCDCRAEWHELPAALRPVLFNLLWAIDTAERFRQRAFAALPSSLTPQVLLDQAVHGRMAPFDTPDFRVEVSKIDQAALMAGMQTLVAAVERTVADLTQNDDLPVVHWRHTSALGEILIDTTGLDNVHVLEAPVLVIDTAGNDRYVLSNAESPEHGRISVLIDLAGDDVYIAEGDAACAAAAVLGYGVLWDGGGQDRHVGAHLAQAAALFGMSLLVSEGGDDTFEALGHAQGFALGGSALLLNRSGNDRYTALTHAQGAGGPSGVALLIDAAGDDHYTLGNEPLAWPSSQSPSHNVSMGQGAGRGLRADQVDGRSLAGGIGGLFDFTGDDRYVAQVFAQGVGFWEGTGLLVDGGGNDHFDAVWYAMGSAAHRAAGVFMALGNGDDRYQVSYATSLGAAHDLSVGVFVDEAGNDHYRLGANPSLGELGFGAANDNSVALFADLAGNDVYQAPNHQCFAFGLARMQAPGTLREVLPGIGLFLDLGGRDSYPSHCNHVRDDTTWSGARDYPNANLPSEVGLGVDGDYPAPFRLTPWSAP